MVKKTLVLLIFVILLSMLYGLQTTEGANVKPGNHLLTPQLKKSTKDEPSSLELLVLSHLVYFNIDEAKSELSLQDFLSSKHFSSITAKFKDELSRNGFDWNVIAKESDLSKWHIYSSERDEQDGFFGAIFKNITTGKFVVAFEGTNSLTTLYEAATLITNNDQDELVESANQLLAKLPKDVKTRNIILTGHSLGGYLAARLGAVKNYKTVAYSALGFNSDYLESLRSKGIIKYTNNITNYVIGGDPVSKIGVHIGKVVILPSKWYWFFPVNHDINTFYQFI